ncbi:MAG TPA: hypothetical protein VF950_07725 [Planctomycetota bacterium]
MRKLLMTALGAVGLLALMAAPAAAQEERVWTGKRWNWVEKKVSEEPKTMLVEVAREERKEGDILGMKTVGKHMENAYFRRMPNAEPAVAKGHACGMRATTVLKHVEFRHYCRVDGAEKPCPGMTEAGECLAVVK